MVRDGDFVAEIGWMGHGLQMWLQTIWFVTRAETCDTLVLDEPDVYLHPDLQRKLIRYIRRKTNQFLVATHSTEILAEAKPSDILIVERARKKSTFSTSLPAVQKIVQEIGSAQNLHLTRLWSAGKLLLVEGKDIKFLKHFQNLLFPNTKNPIDALPNMPIGGWSGWSYAIGSSMLLRNAFNEEIISYCILDSDFHPPNQIEKRLEEAKKKNVNLHIWRKKEIENYLIEPEPIQRLILSESQKGFPSIDEIMDKIEEIANSLKDDTIDCFSQEFFNDNRGKGVPSANKKARQLVEEFWSNGERKLNLVSGKKVLSKLSSWASQNYGFSFGPISLLYEFNKNEIDFEVVRVLSAIENMEKI
jgi:hypothetical protein